MPDPSHNPSTSRNLSEIGHLFLSSVRERQTNGAALPKRQPPRAMMAEEQESPQGPRLAVPQAPRMEVESIELSAEEFRQVEEDPTSAVPGIACEQEAEAAESEPRVPPVTAIVAPHLNGSPVGRAKQYARHLAAQGQRVGLIEVDACEFRLTCFDKEPHATGSAGVEAEESYFDARAMSDAIEELSWDLDRWLLLVPNVRTCEGRALLRDAGHWVVLSTCDHDGVVGCYRTLKGLSETCAAAGALPRLSLALLEAHDAEEAGRTYRKLASVCREFLHWDLDCEPAVGPGAAGVAEHPVMCSRPTRDKGQLAIAPQWQVVAEFLARAKAQAVYGDAVVAQVEDDGIPQQQEVSEEPMAQIATAVAAAEKVLNASAPALEPPAAPRMRMASDREDAAVATVIDLPDESGILAAVLRSEAGELVECPVRPPMCPEARLAVTRDRRVLLLAAARQGLSELRAIGRAFQWLEENYALIGMAMPQLAIDPAGRPGLRLLVDHADANAEVLQAMLRGETVSVQAYRRLRWGGKMGLMLEAA
jgi:hypothetical protein